LYFEGHATPEQRLKLHVSQLGANWRPEITPEELQTAIHTRPQDYVDLLFVGKDWERKGGPLAVEVVKALRQSGTNATLHVVGCRPSIDAVLTDGERPAVLVHGPLYQNVPEERAQLHELYLRSHLLLVPTTAECYGIVFAEAQSFGLPPVSRGIQALPSVILDSETGLLLPPDATPEEYSQRIAALMSNWPQYLAMAAAGVERADHVTSWDRMAETIVDTIFS
jgi:glycosyltransferase involved in cell wall biosynthesis